MCFVSSEDQQMTWQARKSHPPKYKSSHRFLGQLIRQLLIRPGLVLHFLGLLVVVDGQLLQGLQNFLHFIFGCLIFNLQTCQLLLDLLIVSSCGSQKLGRKEGTELVDLLCNARCAIQTKVI